LSTSVLDLGLFETPEDGQRILAELNKVVSERLNNSNIMTKFQTNQNQPKSKQPKQDEIATKQPKNGCHAAFMLLLLLLCWRLIQKKNSFSFKG
jgi:hypothetical protein